MLTRFARVAAVRRLLSTMSNPKCFFDITIGGKASGRIVMELRADTVPKTAGQCALAGRGKWRVAFLCHHRNARLWTDETMLTEELLLLHMFCCVPECACTCRSDSGVRAHRGEQ